MSNGAALLLRKVRSAASLYRRKGSIELLDLARLRARELLGRHRRVPRNTAARARLLADRLNRFSGLSPVALDSVDLHTVRDAILLPYLRHRLDEAGAACHAGEPLAPLEIVIAADCLRAAWDFKALDAALPAWRAQVADPRWAMRLRQVARRTALRLGRLAEAAAGLEEEPADLGGDLLRADVYDAQNRMEEAGRAFRSALRRHGYDAYARQAYGQHLLKAGRILDGLAEWSAADALFGTYPLRRRRPQWHGEPLGSRRLLVMFEHGLGDMIQMARFLPRLAAAHSQATIVGRVPAPLLGLFRRAFPAILFVDEAGPDPEADLFVPSMHLAAALATEDLGRDRPYLPLEPRHHPSRGRRARVGECWRGAPRQYELTRSVPLPLFETLFTDRDLDIVVLLNAVTAAEADRLASHPNVTVPVITDFLDLAAEIAACDVVITVDTAIAHLSGAGGKPTLLLSRPDSCWRWGAAGPTGLWYDSVEVLRHPGDMDWPALIDHARARLRERLAAAIAA